MPVFGYTTTINTTDETAAGKTTTTQTYRMPDKILLREQKDTYVRGVVGNDTTSGTLKLSKSDVKVCDWEGSIYGPNGPLNQPKERSEETNSFGWLPKFSGGNSTLAWDKNARVRTEFTYNSNKQLSLQTTTKSVAETAGGVMTPKDMTIKKYGDQGTGWIQVASDTYTWDDSAKQWVYQATDHGMASDKPGGTRSGPQTSGGGPTLPDPKAINEALLVNNPNAVFNFMPGTLGGPFQWIPLDRNTGQPLPLIV